MTKEAQAAVQGVFLSAADLKGLIEKQQQARAAAEKKHTEEAQAAKKALLEELEKPVQITEQQVANAVSKFRDAAAAGQNEMIVFSFPFATSLACLTAIKRFLTDSSGRALKMVECDSPVQCAGAALV